MLSADTTAKDYAMRITYTDSVAKSVTGLTPICPDDVGMIAFPFADRAVS
jgi:hypothetical protein